MAVTTIEFHELVRLLETNPQWRAELRDVLFPQEFLDLPGVVKELSEAQRRTEEALTRLTERMEKGFAEAATARAEAAADHRRIWESIERLTDQMYTLTKDVGKLKGLTKEIWYQSRVVSIFGLVLT